MKRNKFNLSCTKLATMAMGKIYPVFWGETLPGDTWQMSTAALVRAVALNAPIFHQVIVRIHHWFVPNRLIWDDSGGAETGFEAFITGGSDGTKTPEHPHIDLGTVSEGDLLDYMGIPPGAYGGGGNMEVNALPVRAYNLIFNEWYADQQLTTARTIDKTDGADSTSTTTIASACWEKDYFTTSRTSPTLGTTVTIPLTGDADVHTDVGTGSIVTLYDETAASYQRLDSSGADLLTDTTAGSSANRMFADLSSVSGVDINDLRLALALQRYQEARNNYGARYPEYLSYLGVRPDDASLQRPQYLGGGRSAVQFSEHLVGSESTNFNPGDMVGHGISAMRTNKYQKFFREHGIVMTLMSVVPKTVYANGIFKPWNRTTKEEYFQRELQHIGEEIVENKETYSEHSSPTGTFGYAPRYDSYRRNHSTIAGEFRSTLNHWHMARIFTGDTALNSSFITSVPTDRVYQSTSTDPLMVMAANKIYTRRPIIKYHKAKTF